MRKLFGFEPKVDFAELIINGATIIAVRSAVEFKSGQPTQLSQPIYSINIPLDQIPAKINKIKKMKEPIIVCCASYMCSGRAKRNDSSSWSCSA
ncbi:MAG: rhodanese-like domain-containing protein [Salibacteraceae bacterium]|nr:rhodanese-like domain-containing protein [Salibacteraceae bacterium]